MMKLLRVWLLVFNPVTQFFRYHNSIWKWYSAKQWRLECHIEFIWLNLRLFMHLVSRILSYLWCFKMIHVILPPPLEMDCSCRMGSYACGVCLRTSGQPCSFLVSRLPTSPTDVHQVHSVSHMMTTSTPTPFSAHQWRRTIETTSAAAIFVVQYCTGPPPQALSRSGVRLSVPV